jgi:hypothetical protein
MKTKLFIIVLSLFIVISCKEEEDNVISNNSISSSFKLEGEVRGDTAVFLKWTDLNLDENDSYRIYVGFDSDTSATPETIEEIVDGNTNECLLRLIPSNLFGIKLLLIMIMEKGCIVMLLSLQEMTLFH